MEYRLLRNVVHGERLVIGSDGYVSWPLAGAPGRSTPAPAPDWWRVPRPEYATALWEHPLWEVEARHAPDRYPPRDAAG